MLIWGLWFEAHSWFMLMQVLRDRREARTVAGIGVGVPA